jgi:hypothetical protein
MRACAASCPRSCRRRSWGHARGVDAGGGRREVRSSYGDPPLLHRAALGRRFAQLLEGAS